MRGSRGSLLNVEARSGRASGRSRDTPTAGSCRSVVAPTAPRGRGLRAPVAGRDPRGPGDPERRLLPGPPLRCPRGPADRRAAAAPRKGSEVRLCVRGTCPVPRCPKPACMGAAEGREKPGATSVLGRGWPESVALQERTHMLPRCPGTSQGQKVPARQEWTLPKPGAHAVAGGSLRVMPVTPGHP